MSRINIFRNALRWIDENTIVTSGDGSAITVTNKQHRPYPEVTGYYIPTLLQWGEKERAISYARFLCNIQGEDGAWYDSDNRHPYVFDTGQILKGLVAIYPILPEVKNNIIKGCTWLVNQMDGDGRLVPPYKDTFPKEEDFYSELIHLYCLTPLRDAGKLFDHPEWEEAVVKIINYYKSAKKDKIEDFSLLSHFYAYVMEALVDLGEHKLARKALYHLDVYQQKTGGIPGLKNVSWVCSTGLFQLALVWYKLGEYEKGHKIFDYACKLQNSSGGWYGSYPSSWLKAIVSRKDRPKYFQKEEISWANKYFLDALYWDQKLHFEQISAIFLDNIKKDDGRYLLIKKYLEDMEVKNGNEKTLAVCDAGCGKGRYLKNLMVDLPNNHYHAMDLSEAVMVDIKGVDEKRTGTLTDIPYDTDSFDVIYACESLEHAINIEGALSELLRVCKPKGKVIIIDKTIEKLHKKAGLDEWEQWIDDVVIKDFARNNQAGLQIINSVPYEDNNDGMFRAWILEK